MNRARCAEALDILRRESDRGEDRIAVAAERRGRALHLRRRVAHPDRGRDLRLRTGEVVLQLHRDWAPLGVDRFYNLAKNGFYDDSRVYRVMDGFMAQFGIHEDPYVTQAWKKQFIVDDPVVGTNSRGRVTFAKGGLHTRTTELFINYRDNPALDEDGFSPIGEVIEGMEVVDTFYAAYGDGPPRGSGPYAAMAEARGNEYLDTDFGELTQIICVTLEEGG